MHYCHFDNDSRRCSIDRSGSVGAIFLESVDIDCGGIECEPPSADGENFLARSFSPEVLPDSFKEYNPDCTRDPLADTENQDDSWGYGISMPSRITLSNKSVVHVFLFERFHPHLASYCSGVPVGLAIVEKVGKTAIVHYLNDRAALIGDWGSREGEVVSIVPYKNSFTVLVEMWGRGKALVDFSGWPQAKVTVLGKDVPNKVSD